MPLRSILRSLFRQPVASTIIILVLALGIGSNTAIFSVVHSILLKPLNYPASDRLLKISSFNPKQTGDNYGLAPATMADLRRSLPPGLEALAGSLYDYVNLSGITTPVQLTVSKVTGDYFRVLGSPALLGRPLNAADCLPTSAPVIVLGNELWRKLFASSPAIIGRSLLINDRSIVVVGVMPAGFSDPDNVAEAWLPMPENSPDLLTRADHSLDTIGRIAPGVSLEKLQESLKTASLNLSRIYPKEETDWTIHAESLLDSLVKEHRHALFLLLGAVGFVLLITCVNVANLQFLRTIGQRHELGIRLALGASRSHIVGQILGGNLLLNLLGGALGIAAGSAALQSIRALLPGGFLPRVSEISLTWPVFFFAIGIVLLCSIATGLLPAWLVVRQADRGVMTLGGDTRTASTGPVNTRLRGVLVTIQVALAFILLIGATVVTTNFLRLVHTPSGMRTEGVLSMVITLSSERYPTREARAANFEKIITQVRAVPGVQEAAWTSTTPFNWTIRLPFLLEGQTPGDSRIASQQANYDSVSSNYFALLQIPLLRGRLFSADDRFDRPVVAVINQAMARTFFSNTDPLGKTLFYPNGGAPFQAQIVGIVADVRRIDLKSPPPEQIYLSSTQKPGRFSVLLVRARDGLKSETLTHSVQKAVWQVDPAQPVTDATTLDEILATTFAPERLYFILLTGFASVALILATLGIYGAIAYNVDQRIREIGIRLALGATAGQVVALVTRQGMVTVALGLGLGAILSLLGENLAKAWILGWQPVPLATLAMLFFFLAAIALVACWLPARRAAAIDPSGALRKG